MIVGTKSLLITLFPATENWLLEEKSFNPIEVPTAEVGQGN